MRTSRETLHEEALEALAAVCEKAGLRVRHGSHGNELAINGTRVAVLARAVAQPIAAVGRPAVVVADQVSDTTRMALRETGVGWFDRRGHLYLPMLSPITDMPVPAMPRHTATGTRTAGPFGRGRAPIEVAVDVILHKQATGVRRLAAEVELSPAAISMARRRLRESFLLNPDDGPILPELFEALARVWRPSWQALAGDPGGPVDASPGAWVRTGDLAAAMLGAPIAVGSAAPGQYYMRTPRQLHDALLQFGQADDASARCWVAVAPSRLSITRANKHVESQAAPWTSGPVAPAAVVALELAQDPGLGAEILASWHLDEGSPWRTR